jgi:hypothetical protein
MNNSSLDANWRLVLSSLDELPSSLLSIQSSTTFLDLPSLWIEYKNQKQSQSDQKKNPKPSTSKTLITYDVLIFFFFFVKCLYFKLINI